MGVWSGVGREYPFYLILSSGFQMTVVSNNVIALVVVLVGFLIGSRVVFI